MVLTTNNRVDLADNIDRLIKARIIVEERLLGWQAAAEETLKQKLLSAIFLGRKAMLERFDQTFGQVYMVKNFAKLIYALNSEHFDPIVSFKHLMPFRFRFLTLPYTAKNALGKALSFNNALKVISKIETNPFSDALDDAAEQSFKTGGQSSFASLGINVDFKIIDRVILDWLRSYSLNLSDSIAQSISSRIRFQILEGVRNGESIPQIRRRIEKVWSEPIDVSVPAKTDSTGRIIRPGYTYQLSNEAWADVVARTEVSRAFAEGRLAAYTQMGVVGMVKFSASPDERTCAQCAALDGTEFSLNDAVGIIPLHGRCRCTWIPIVDANDTQAARTAAFENISVLYDGLE